MRAYPLRVYSNRRSCPLTVTAATRNTCTHRHQDRSSCGHVIMGKGNYEQHGTASAECGLHPENTVLRHRESAWWCMFVSSAATKDWKESRATSESYVSELILSTWSARCATVNTRGSSVSANEASGAEWADASLFSPDSASTQGTLLQWGIKKVKSKFISFKFELKADKHTISRGVCPERRQRRRRGQNASWANCW